MITQSKQLDVQNAFLHVDLEEAVYMQQSTGFVHPEYPSYVCKLRKAIYGLKQAPRALFSKLSNKLFSLGFQECKMDTSLFIYRTASHVIFVLIYVDDFIVTRSDSNLIYEFISALGASFPVKHLGQLHYFLGVQIFRNNEGLFLSQSKYILDLLQRTNMHQAKPVSTPMSVTTKLSAFDSPTFEDPLTYRSVVGSLQYLAFTRPDISFDVNKVCQYMHNPKISHWQAVKRILRYLRFTSHFGLFSLNHLHVHFLPSLMLTGLVALMIENSLEVFVSSLALTWSLGAPKSSSPLLDLPRRLNIKPLPTPLVSKDQLADVLTKPLSTARFATLRSSLTINPVPHESRGAVKDKDYALHLSAIQKRRCHQQSRMQQQG